MKTQTIVAGLALFIILGLYNFLHAHWVSQNQGIILLVLIGTILIFILFIKNKLAFSGNKIMTTEEALKFSHQWINNSPWKQGVVWTISKNQIRKKRYREPNTNEYMHFLGIVVKLRTPTYDRKDLLRLVVNLKEKDIEDATEVKGDIYLQDALFGFDPIDTGLREVHGLKKGKGSQNVYIGGIPNQVKKIEETEGDNER